MVPPGRHDHGKTTNHKDDLLTLADKLHQRLAEGAIDQPLCAKIRHALGNFNPRQVRSNINTAEFDKQGTTLWNTATRLQHNDTSDTANATKVLPLLRSFALLLLHTAHQASSRKSTTRPEATIRILRTSLKAAKSCIDSSELDLASEILQRAADYVDFLTGGDRRNEEESHNPIDTAAADLSAEYWTIRAALSWKQNRLDTAAVYLGKVNTRINKNGEVAEKVADLAYEIGKDLMKDKKHEEASRWLDKATEAIDTIEHDQLSQEALELRSAILADLVRNLLALKNAASLNRATDVLSYLDSDTSSGSRLGIHLLKFQTLEARQSKDPNEYNTVLRSMIQTTILSQQSFKTIMHHIQKLHSLSPTMAQQSLETLISTRLFEHGEMDMIEKATVMRTWSAVQAASDGSAAESLNKVLNDISSSISQVFSEEATHAAQTLLWKAIETVSEANQSEVAERWCRLSAHKLFTKAGESNKSILTRKTMINALSNNKPSYAREIFFQMPKSGQETPASQYLLYRVALREGDNEIMQDCLSKLVQAKDKDTLYLYACVQEAQNQGSREQAISALQHVLEKFGCDVPSGVHLPALLRCTIQMMLLEAEQDTGKAVAAVSQCCQMFMAAATHFKKTEAEATSGESTDLELDWFAKSSYNLVLKHFDDLGPDLVLQLLDACVSFTNLSAQAADAETSNKLMKRALLCHYLSASITVVLARSDDNISSSEQYYLSVLKHCSAFVSKLSDTTGVISNQDTKQSQLLQYEIEALLKLHQWSDLDLVLQRCIDNPSTNNIDTFADLIISVHGVMIEEKADPKHQQMIPKVMQSIINQSWQKEKHNISKLAKWLRCVFRMTITSSPDTALRIVEQATSIADKTPLMESQRYPPEELEWLASTAFNTAVDRFCASDEDGCRVWAEAALNLAQKASGVGAGGLYTQMQGLWGRLRREGGMV
ncbi:meiosis protein SPO22/ZIP4 like-domain-containing protein [Elsinoe ampelina]|uniref:Protein ZIP4 homolog n=1 Tax=Elsinoe ampelina TaxID=302913 RepID=A0A6A6GH52_9PEZI|nr:meiosis protein SPO22/ZIP4 like-domain-containing protein [Elsinoe ampelina]